MIVNSASAHNMLSHFWRPNVNITNDVFLSARKKISKGRKEE